MLMKDLEREQFRIMPEQLEELARMHHRQLTGAVKLTGTYLRCLLAAVKAIGSGDVLTTIDKVHSEYMVHLERGVTTAEVADAPELQKKERQRRRLEVQRRLKFARSTKSELHTFAKLGGNIHALNPSTLMRSTLRDFIRMSREALPFEANHAETPVGKRLEASTLSRFDRMIESLKGLAKVPDEPPEAVLDVIQELQNRLTELSDTIVRDATEPRKPRRMPVQPGQRVGELNLWPH